MVIVSNEKRTSKALREVEADFWLTGAKAAAEATREATRAIFMMMVMVSDCWIKK